MKILVSGLLNMETTTAVRGFPINYYPIDYAFFGVNSAPAGVAYNISLALNTLGDDLRLCSMIGNDFTADYIKASLEKAGISTDHIKHCLDTTPTSVILYDPEGRRQIYCDLKDIQDRDYGFDGSMLDGVDIVVACNINFNRPLLRLAREQGKIIATDVHVLSNPYDDYNREFMGYADILFLSDEGVGDDYRGFIHRLAEIYNNKIIVLGRGSKGAAIYTSDSSQIVDMPACNIGGVVNTVGAGDALFSSFVHFYSKGLTPIDALSLAQKFAAYKIRTTGASKGLLTEEELLNAN